LSLKINHGCGNVRPANWLNTDSSINALFQRIPYIGKILPRFFHSVKYNSSNVVYVNLNKRWNQKSNSVDVIYASHLFEHLCIKSRDLFLQEAYRVLKQDGIIRLVVPDLYKICKKYVNEFEANEIKNPSSEFMWAINMHVEGQYGDMGFIKRKLAQIQGYPHQHKFMYDQKSIGRLLEKNGFVRINFMSYGESNYIKDIQDVEGEKESYLSVYAEAIKP
jgi:predicted SAM-dependent methyltransferase